MKRPAISVIGPAQTPSAPWQFWSAPLGDLSDGEVAGDYVLQSNNISEDGWALGDVSAYAASDLTPNELANGASLTAFDDTIGNIELTVSDLSESQEVLSGYPAPDIDPARGVSESGGVAAPSIASPPAVLSAASPSDTLNSLTYAPTAAAPAIPLQLPPAVTFRGFGATAAQDAAQAPVEIAAHQDHNIASGAAAIDGREPGTQAFVANPAVDTWTPVADSAVGPGGATAAQVQQALDESGLSVNGSGIRVGVLSDSFNNLGGAAADEADGALPPASDIEVLKDLPSGGTDEGRAMMQIIHDIAPGASLAFYTAFDSEQDFANGILALAAAGCKVIVDDVSYFDEPFFQNGVVAQAIQTVEAEGVTYVTAAGNDASNGYQSAWTPISGTYNGTTLTDAESFGGSLVQTITINTEGTGYDIPLLLEWNQAYGQATSDLEILVFNSHGQLVGTATNASSNELTNPWVEYDFSQSGTYYVAIENLSGPNPGLIKEITEGDGLPATISGANSGTVFGHAMTPGAISTGAVSTADTPAFGFSSPVAESFSSSGAGTELLFANNGNALSSPDVLSPVAVSGVDDIETTVPGGLSDFYGTSAAAASLAGVAALLLSANPNLTPAQVEQIMEETALPMSNSAVSGAGLVQVDAAVAAAIPGPKVTVANVALTQASVAASSLFTASDSDGYTITEYGFEDTGSGHFVLNGAAQPNNQEIDVSAAQLTQLTYQSSPGTTDTIDIRAEDQNGWGDWASFVATAPPLVIQTDTNSFGSTSLAEQGGDYFLYAAGTTNGPELEYNGTSVTTGGAWKPIGAAQTATGYEIAWQLSGTNEFEIWNVNSTGNYVSDSGVVSGTSFTLESAETIFNQDLNGDGTIGVNPTPIQTDVNSYGTTSLGWLGNDYVIGNGTTSVLLTYDGSPVTTGGAWAAIGAAQTATGYEVAWHLSGTNEFEIWKVNSNGNYVSDSGVVSGTSFALESAETTFNQDLNGDGTIGLNTTLIQTDVNSYGTTSLGLVGNEYVIGNGTTSVLLAYDGSPVTTGGAWKPIGAVETATGYEVAWHLSGTNEFDIWNVNSNGNYVSDGGVVSGTSFALESAETTFNQDLNGDGTIGLNPTLIQTDVNSYGTTSLGRLGNEYVIGNGTTSVLLTYDGSPVTTGGAWTPIGAAQTATGYEVAWQLSGTNEFEIWNVNSTGNYLSDGGVVSGTSVVLEQAETTFNQDLNGEGVIGIYAAPGTTLQISQPLTGASGAATIGAGATLELASADSASITFAASTGMLKLDQPATFTGEIFGFTGNGQLSGSDQIDLAGINYNTVQDSYANGVLTVTDGSGDTATLNFNGSYTLANFQFASDGTSGTIVYDPPVPDSAVAGTSATVATDHGNDTFVFHPNLGTTRTNQTPEINTAFLGHGALDGPAFTAAHDPNESLTAVDAAHDWIAFHTNAAAQQHHHGFLV
jgi:hypothetical protein